MYGEVAGYVNKTELHDIQRYLSDNENLKVRLKQYSNPKNHKR
jgi:hypothetical protein